jgi:hypothetical protein
VGFVVDEVALGQVFSEYFGFPCQSSFHQILHHNHPGQVQYAIQWPTCRVEPVWTPHPTIRIKKNYHHHQVLKDLDHLMTALDINCPSVFTVAILIPSSS